MTVGEVVGIAAAIIAAMAAVIGVMWRRNIELEKASRRDLHKVIGWPRSDEPPPSEQLKEPPLVIRGKPPKLPPRR